MARRFTVDEWQQRLNTLNQPVVIVGKRQAEKKEIFTILCYKCGFTFDADRRALHTACALREKGRQTNWCPICNKVRVIENYNDVATLRKDLLKYFVNPVDAKNIGIGNHSRARLRCPECGMERTQDVGDLCARGFYCNYCSDKISMGNKIIRNLVYQLPVDEYVVEYSDTWTQRKIYDCYFLYIGTTSSSGSSTTVDSSFTYKIKRFFGALSYNSTSINNGGNIVMIGYGIDSNEGRLYAYTYNNKLYLWGSSSSYNFNNRGYALTVQYTK